MGRTISNGSDPYRYSKSSQQSGGGFAAQSKLPLRVLLLGPMYIP